MKSLLRNLLMLCLLASVPAGARAQADNARQGRLNQLETAKIAYITEKLALTPDQAQRFWPVYNEFTAKRRDVNRRMRQLRTDDPEAQSDQQIRESLSQALALRQQEVSLEKEYFEKFQKVLTIRQVGKLFMAERQFTKEVLKRVTDRRGGRPGVGPRTSGSPAN
ncbi:Spy/CpxP family protein refolding chaperone [Hymenobacter psychrotolerans]|uniref:LTXXQ motif family protein n=1 Tax=Hymenobacter psychrotolerans DSM 18569 TaxID=1121959 RepID=A0A1M6X653_9BACT|nr:Spy/CpxP family protein refolding chaperone [Hymenobacter psychrotolerans]SHL01329.1 hypothetical protein SAMN02746009_01945 [Hymenobacter psychrotolerans DSM 18569]